MAIFHSLEFDGINSLDNGVYITGEAVYNAPERNVEMIEIPGRNGAFALDKGRYENITVTYPAGAFGADQAEFAKKIRAFRNLMASKGGYKRLVDTYNPDEYRMALFKDAFEVGAVSQSKAGEFSLVFDCKPQRFLMSGEAAIDVSNGDTIYNPTPFDASPMLEVEGYGTIAFNGYEIELEDTELGDIVLGSAVSGSDLIVFDESKVNAGDHLYFSGNAVYYSISIRGNVSGSIAQAVTDSVTNAEVQIAQMGETLTRIAIFPDTSNGFVEGTAASIESSWSGTVTITPPGGSSETYNVTAYVPIHFDGRYFVDFMHAAISGITSDDAKIVKGFGSKELSAISTVGALGNPTYIDCDLGEVYMIKDGSLIALNRYVDLGSDLPKLASGANEITLDNTIRDLKIIPRWWII